MVVRAIEIYAGRFGAVSDRAGLGEELVSGLTPATPTPPTLRQGFR
jgi:hypothetical protein